MLEDRDGYIIYRNKRDGEFLANLARGERIVKKKSFGFEIVFRIITLFYFPKIFTCVKF